MALFEETKGADVISVDHQKAAVKRVLECKFMFIFLEAQKDGSGSVIKEGKDATKNKELVLNAEIRVVDANKRSPSAICLGDCTFSTKPSVFYKKLTLNDLRSDMNIKLCDPVASIFDSFDDLNSLDNKQGQNTKDEIDIMKDIEFYYSKNPNTISVEFVLLNEQGYSEEKDHNGENNQAGVKITNMDELIRSMDEPSRCSRLQLKCKIELHQDIVSQLQTRISCINLTLLAVKSPIFKYSIKPLIKLGARVKRGEDWDTQEEKLLDIDGGKDNYGLLISYDSVFEDGNKDSMFVYWPKTKKVGHHRFGVLNAIDVQLVSHNMKNGDVIPSCANKRCENKNIFQYCDDCHLCNACILNQKSCVPLCMGGYDWRIRCRCGCIMIKINEPIEVPNIVCNECKKPIKYSKDQYFYQCPRGIGMIAHYLGCEYHLECAEKYIERDGSMTATPEMPLEIVVIGPIGAGKSSLCNTILGKPKFKSSESATGCTSSTQHAFGTWLDQENSPYVHVVDTPGMLDTEKRDEQFAKEAYAFIRSVANGINAFLFVMNGTDPRCASYLFQAAKLFEEKFTPRFWDHVILVYTRCDPDCLGTWYTNTPSHMLAPSLFKNEFKFKTTTLDVFHVSNRHPNSEEFKKLLACIQQKPKFTCDFIDRVINTMLANWLGRIAINAKIREIMEQFVTSTKSKENVKPKEENVKPKEENVKTKENVKPKNVKPKENSDCIIL